MCLLLNCSSDLSKRFISTSTPVYFPHFHNFNEGLASHTLGTIMLHRITKMLVYCMIQSEYPKMSIWELGAHSLMQF